MSFIGMPDTDIAEVMVFGDSIAYGAWDNNGGWVQRLREPIDVKNLIDEGVAYFVYNLGVVDDTSTGVLKRFETEITARTYLNSNQKRIVIFAIGENDSLVLVKEKACRISKNEFEQNINKLIDLSKKWAHQTVFVGLTPVEEVKAIPLPWDESLAYKNNVIKEYNTVLKSVCKKRKVFFIEIFNEMMKLDYKELLEDGIHPSPAGHLFIYEIVREFLTKHGLLDFAISKNHRMLYSPKGLHH